MAGVVDGQRADNPVLRKCRFYLGTDEVGIIESSFDCLDLSFKIVLTGKSVKTINRGANKILRLSKEIQ